uniref:Uncharacterized protein n=1 Tax=Physcomitrium patens TaxID=3218 RepID=A0A2K1JPZ7_PHYPA|nr:hypothetical protein PHYPA_015867 [Physcomitrium patens]
MVFYLYNLVGRVKGLFWKKVSFGVKIPTS